MLLVPMQSFVGSYPMFDRCSMDFYLHCLIRCTVKMIIHMICYYTIMEAFLSPRKHICYYTVMKVFLSPRKMHHHCLTHSLFIPLFLITILTELIKFSTTRAISPSPISACSNGCSQRIDHSPTETHLH